MIIIIRILTTIIIVIWTITRIIIIIMVIVSLSILMLIIEIPIMITSLGGSEFRASAVRLRHQTELSGGHVNEYLTPSLPQRPDPLLITPLIRAYRRSETLLAEWNSRRSETSGGPWQRGPSPCPRALSPLHPIAPRTPHYSARFVRAVTPHSWAARQRGAPLNGGEGPARPQNVPRYCPALAEEI